MLLNPLKEIELSEQEAVFEEVPSVYDFTREAKVDLLPDAATIEPAQRIMLNETRWGFYEIGIKSLKRDKNLGRIFEKNRLMFLDTALFLKSISATYSNTRGVFLDRIMQEEQKFSCGSLRNYLICYPFFKSTKELLKPFAPRESIFIHPELKAQMQNDLNLRKIIDAAVIESTFVLKNEDSRAIEVFEEKDYEVPNWTENIVLVKIEKGSFEEKMRLWEDLEEKIRTKIREIRKQVSPSEKKKIDALNEHLSIRVEEIP